METPTIFGISTYDFFNILAAIVVIIYITIFLKVTPRRNAFFTGIIFMALGIIGARLLWACYDLENRFTFEQLFRIDYGSMDLGGAFLILPVGFFIAKKLFKAESKNLFNVWAEVVIIASAFAKIGCFSAGCCLGIPTDLPWAVNGLHPVQLYEVAIWIIVYIAVMLTKDRMNQINRVCLIVIGCILIRMPIETLRADAQLFIEGGYWIAYQVAVIVSIIVLFINNRKNLKKSLIVFMIVSLALLIGIVGYQKFNKEYKNNSLIDSMIYAESIKNKTNVKYVELREDGVIVNISPKLFELKYFNEFEIVDTRLTKDGDIATLTANVKNITSEVQGDYLVNIILLNNMGKELDRMEGKIDKIKPGETMNLIVSEKVKDYDYVYDANYEIKNK